MFLAATVDRSGKQQSGRFGRYSLELIDKTNAVELGHHQVRQHQVDTAGLQDVDGTFRIRASQDTVTPGLKEHFADGERAFIVVDAENRTFRFHLPHTEPSLSACTAAPVQTCKP